MRYSVNFSGTEKDQISNAVVDRVTSARRFRVKPLTTTHHLRAFPISYDVPLYGSPHNLTLNIEESLTVIS